jgi:hypothetical protein
MGQIRDWGAMREMCARLLKERTGEDEDTWNRSIREADLHSESELRAWLAAKGITGYAQKLLARIQPTTKSRVDLALRLEGRKPTGRLQPSKIHETMKLQISLSTVEEIDSEVLDWMQLAFDENS